ncbi:MAG: FRG domain-containing protein, partial [Marinosulfonomonas sp.]|nr:FRG domain-containing protein [Marinosulfonomonas sp.]
MARNPFTSREQVERVWEVLDRLARRAWDRGEVEQSQKERVHSAAGTLQIELISASSDLPADSDVPLHGAAPAGVGVNGDKFFMFANHALVDMIGREHVNSIAEAFLKTKSLMRMQAKSNSGHQRFFFRGHRDITWELVPRKGRALRESGWQPPEIYLDEQDRTTTVPLEIDSLEAFKASWKTHRDIDDIDRDKLISEDSPEWWFRMQHYDTGHGTRMLDITTSLTSALLFACVDWSTGLVDDGDDSKDGVIYFWVEGTIGVDDFLIRTMPKSDNDFFNNGSDAPRLIVNPPHNERSKAQAGGFLWWPQFWKSLPECNNYGGNTYHLRIPKAAKR